MATKIFPNVEGSFLRPFAAGPTGIDDSGGAGFNFFGPAGGGIRRASASAGSSDTAITRNTVASGTILYFGSWVSDPFAAGFTLSGTVTFNFWLLESNAMANLGMACRIYKIAAIDGSLTLVNNSAIGTEPGTSTSAQQWTATPTSTVFLKGDRLLIIPYAANVGTMASTFTTTMRFGGTVGAASGDSWVQLNENVTFTTATPAGSSVYPTTTVSDVNAGAGVDEFEAWTSRGSGVTSAVRDTAAGPTSALQWTVSAGGNTIEWYTKKLTAFTLSGTVTVNFRAKQSDAAGNCMGVAEIAVVNDDGTGATVWSKCGILNGTNTTQMGFAEDAFVAALSGIDVSVTNGQRLRFRFYIDEDYAANNQPMVTGKTATLYYAGTSGGASGDTFATLTQSVTEFSATRVPRSPGVDSGNAHF